MPQLTPFFAVFSVAAVALYWAVPRAWRPGVLALTSTAFLAVLDPVDAGLMIGLVAWTWLARAHPAAGIGALVAVFVALRGLEAGQAIAPLGFGFLACRLVAWLADRDAHAPHGWWALYSYALFWPAVVVGPIHRFPEFVRDQRRQRWDPQLVADGLERVLYGLAKITVLSHWLVGVHLYNAVQLHLAVPRDAGTVLAECGLYGLQLYLSFAGCSDVAIGLGRVLGFRLPENFHWPFLQRNLSAFWESWHATLSLWCRQHVFLPVFSRSRRTIPALVASMLALAGWHELSGRYLAWGVYHAAGLAVLRLYRVHAADRLPELPGPLGQVLATALTVSFVVLGFVFTKNADPTAIAADLRLLGGL